MKTQKAVEPHKKPVLPRRFHSVGFLNQHQYVSIFGVALTSLHRVCLQNLGDDVGQLVRVASQNHRQGTKADGGGLGNDAVLSDRQYLQCPATEKLLTAIGPIVRE